MGNKKLNDELMALGEEVFWSEFNSQDERDGRCVIVDGDSGRVVMSGVRLIKEKKKVKV